MKDIMQKLAELEATAPKITKKKMLKEDSTTPPMNVSNKPASFKDVFAALSENVAPGQKPLPVMDPANKQAGMGFVTSNNPAVQNMLKNLDPKDVQIVQAPGQPGQPQVGQQQQQQTGQPNQAGATGQPQQGQLAMREKDEGKPGKNFAKIAKSAGKRYGSKEAGERVAGAVRAKLMKQGKIEEEQLDELSPELLNRASQTASDKGMATTDALNKAGYQRKPAVGKYYSHEPHPDEEKLLRQQNKFSKGARDAARRDAMKNEGAKVDRMVKHIEKSERGLGKSKDKASDIAWATANKRGMLDNKNKKKVKEGDLPSSAGVDTRGAGLGAGRSATTLEGKKPDFLDLDKDGNKKEPMKKAAADKNKKKVKESMNHRISAARLEGKSHGLRGHAHSGKRYEDLDEIRAYHEGYKEGLDESYGMGMYETAPAMPAATVPGMASAAIPTMEDDMEEGNAFTAALAKTPKGGKFSVGGKTFTDRTGYDAKVNEYAFESLDQQLNALLNESEEVSEGLSVSISKGQQNSPDSVTITAQDAEAEHLLAFVKNAGLGLFGDDNADTHSSAMSVQPGAADEVGAGGVDLEVVDGHDGMMGLMQKLSGIQSGGAEDYADEEGDEEQLYGNHEEASEKDCGCDGDCECSDYDQPSNEETCNECGGMMEAGHSCGSEMVDEVETEDQEEFEVAEDNAPDSDEAETSADENAEAEEDKALAGAASGDEEEIDEGFTFESIYKKFAMLEDSADKPKHPKHDEKDDKDSDDAEDEEKVNEAKEDTEEEDEKAEKAGKKVAKDIEYDDKKEKIDEWANDAGKKGTDTSFEQDIDFMTKVISGGLNKPKSTGQTTVPVIAGQTERMSNPKESVNESVSDWVKLAGIK